MSHRPSKRPVGGDGEGDISGSGSPGFKESSIVG